MKCFYVFCQNKEVNFFVHVLSTYQERDRKGGRVIAYCDSCWNRLNQNSPYLINYFNKITKEEALAFEVLES